MPPIGATGDYRVLRRLRPRTQFHPDDPSVEILVGIVLDVETTGLDHGCDEIIELSMLTFEFSRDGRVFRILDVFEELREPSLPIPPEIARLTGIEMDMVAGKSIDPDHVSAFAASAAVVIAHNANFDRRFVEKAFPIFSTKAWACSLTQVEWAQEGFDGSRLGYLLSGYGFYHDGHRASEDCHALLEVLSRELPMSGEIGLKRLLDAARKPTWRVWATNSPYELREKLKLRKYRWNDGEDARPRAWWTDVSDDALEEELRYLRTEIYGYEAKIPLRRVTAFDRFSGRV